ncbi:NUDIX domain-containing protein [soil metagenome]
MMSGNDKDSYFVAVKLFLRDGDKLLITHDVFGAWDLPGGRLITEEFDKPLESVIERKIREELGADVKYKLGEPRVFFRVERHEHGLDKKVRIFAIGYDAEYQGGKVELWENHDQMKWVDINTFQPEDYFTGGWLAGVREYFKKIAERNL